MPETSRPIYHAHLPLTLCVLYNIYYVVCVLCYRKVDKAEKLDGGEGGKRGESLVARTLGV